MKATASNRILGLLSALLVLAFALPSDAITGGVVGGSSTATGPGSWTYTTTVTSASSPYTAHDG